MHICQGEGGDEIVPIIMTSHGSLASSMMETAGLIIEMRDEVYCLELKEEESLEDFKCRLGKLIQCVKGDSDKVIIVSDMPLATPFNAATMLMQQVLILLKKIDALKRLYEQGLCFDSVQIGGLASGPGRKLVVKAIGLSEQDAVELKSLGKQGVKIYFQSMPGEKEILLDTILGKYFNNIK